MQIEVDKPGLLVPGIQVSIPTQDFTTLPIPLDRHSLWLLCGDNGSGKTCTFEKFESLGPSLLPRTTPPSVLLIDQMFEKLLYHYKPIWWNIMLPQLLTKALSAESAVELAEKEVAKFNLSIDVTRYPVELSGGEKHIVVLLRASLAKPSLLLLDEPFVGLDVENTERLIHLLQDLRSSGQIILFSSHRTCENPVVTFAGFHGKPLRVCRATSAEVV